MSKPNGTARTSSNDDRIGVADEGTHQREDSHLGSGGVAAEVPPEREASGQAAVAKPHRTALKSSRIRFERYRQYGSFPCLMFEIGRFSDWYVSVCVGSRVWKVSA